MIRIDTPGGLDSSMRQIVDRMLNCRTPVAVFVGPSGARAASAGFIITVAADVAAMAPGTNIGAAHPVAGIGQMDEVMSKKVTSDAAAYIRSKAERRGRNVEMAEKAVVESKSFTEKEALELQADRPRGARRARPAAPSSTGARCAASTGRASRSASRASAPSRCAWTGARRSSPRSRGPRCCSCCCSARSPAWAPRSAIPA